MKELSKSSIRSVYLKENNKLLIYLTFLDTEHFIKGSVLPFEKLGKFSFKTVYLEENISYYYKSVYFQEEITQVH